MHIENDVRIIAHSMQAITDLKCISVLRVQVYVLHHPPLEYITWYVCVYHLKINKIFCNGLNLFHLGNYAEIFFK